MIQPTFIMLLLCARPWAQCSNVNSYLILATIFSATRTLSTTPAQYEFSVTFSSLMLLTFLFILIQAPLLCAWVFNVVQSL